MDLYKYNSQSILHSVKAWKKSKKKENANTYFTLENMFKQLN